ncbi:hypothetical protein ACFY93_10780 [Streptomyces sp. NPDC008313]|uniref:hypothetical protein n=1 Tax=Streptomyces sp. NPDC008313 TaxID=3364826 RepID=UPI0036F0B8E1
MPRKQEGFAAKHMPDGGVAALPDIDGAWDEPAAHELGDGPAVFLANADGERVGDGSSEAMDVLRMPVIAA